MVAAVLALLLAVRVVAVGMALSGDATRGKQTVLPGDVHRYHQLAMHRGVPYRDFAVEYPPLTLAAINLVDGGTVRRTTVRLMWSQLVLDLVIAALLAWGWGRRTAIAYLVLGLAFLWYPFLYLRLDLLSVALAVAGLALVRKRRWVAGGVLLGAACFAKVWPLALAPELAARRSWRVLAAFVSTLVLGLGAWVSWSGGDGPTQVLTFRGAKGWQVESSVGAIVHLLHGGSAVIEQGAARMGVVPGWAKGALLLAALLGALFITMLARGVPTDDVRVHDGLTPTALVAVLLVTATLLSPQYVVWLVPFAAIAAARGERAVGALVFAVAFLSTLGLNLVRELNSGDLLPMTVIVLRNGILLALVGYAVVRVAHSPRAVPAGATRSSDHHDRPPVPRLRPTAPAVVPRAALRAPIDPSVPAPTRVDAPAPAE